MEQHTTLNVSEDKPLENTPFDDRTHGQHLWEAFSNEEKYGNKGILDVYLNNKFRVKEKQYTAPEPTYPQDGRPKGTGLSRSLGLDLALIGGASVSFGYVVDGYDNSSWFFNFSGILGASIVPIAPYIWPIASVSSAGELLIPKKNFEAVHIDMFAGKGSSWAWSKGPLTDGFGANKAEGDEPIDMFTLQGGTYISRIKGFDLGLNLLGGSVEWKAGNTWLFFYRQIERSFSFRNYYLP